MSKATAGCKSRLKALPAPEALTGLADDVSGPDDACSHVMLCAMRMAATADGFYTVVSSVPLRGAGTA